MNDINSLPPVPESTILAMQREAERKFGKVEGIEEAPQPTQLNPLLAHHEEPIAHFEDSQSIQSAENEEQESIDSDSSKELSDKEYNFKVIREKAKQAERERDEALKLLREMTESRKQAAPVMQEESDPFTMNPDDLVEGKHLSKVAQEIKSLKEQLKSSQQQSYMSQTEARLKAQYPDLERVLTPDNIETFKMAYPELASTIDSTPDMYTKAVSAYTMIKKFGVYQEPGTNMEKDMAKKNAAKPRPLSTISPQQGATPISRANAFANGLTKELQEQLFKEMSQARKGY